MSEPEGVLARISSDENGEVWIDADAEPADDEEPDVENA